MSFIYKFLKCTSLAAFAYSTALANANQYVFTGIPEKLFLKIENQSSNNKCGIALTLPSGETIDYEAPAPNFILTIDHTAQTTENLVFKWKGKLLFKGIPPTLPCNGSGEIEIPIVSNTPILKSDDLEILEQAKSKLAARQTKDALDTALPIAIRGSKTAQSMVAFIFMNGGESVNRDPRRAYQFAQLSSSERNSKIILGVINLNGIGRPQNCQDGINYLSEAVALDLPAAYSILGEAYMNGRCTTRNYEEALRLFQRGTEKRNGTSAAGIGSIYENGFGVAINLEEAKIWYQRAREFGHLRADDMIQRIDRKIATGEETRKKSEEEARLASRRKEISDENDRKRMEIERLQGELRKMQPGPSK